MLKAEPSVAVHVRIDLASDKRRRRLLRALKVRMPELVSLALAALEMKLNAENEQPRAA